MRIKRGRDATLVYVYHFYLQINSHRLTLSVKMIFNLIYGKIKLPRRY